MNNSVAVEISANLYEHAQKAFEFGLQALNASDALVPFGMVWRDGEIVVDRYMNGAYDDSIEAAMRAVNQADDDVSAYAIVWNGYVKDDGEKIPAVVIEAGERKSGSCLQLAQPYELNPDDATVSAKGEMLSLGAANNLLLSKVTTFDLEAHLIKSPYATTNSLRAEVCAQPYAQMPVAIICLAANLFEGDEAHRVTLGLDKLRELESTTEIPMSRKVFSNLLVATADGDLMNVLPSDDVEDLIKIAIDGAAQLNQSVVKGLVWDKHAEGYLAEVKSLLDAVLATEDGNTPAGTEKLIALMDKLTATA